MLGGISRRRDFFSGGVAVGLGFFQMDKVDIMLKLLYNYLIYIYIQAACYV